MTTTDVATVSSTEVICPSLPRLSFTQGVLAGQFSFVVLAVLFLKYFVFENPSSHAATTIATQADRMQQNASKDRKRTRPRKSSLSASAYSAAISTPALLDALDYDLPSHAPESLDWLNVLMAQTLSAYRALVLSGEGGPRTLLEKALNRADDADTPSGIIGIDRIEVQDVVLGDKYPLLSNARVRPSGENGGVRVEVDLDFSDSVSLSVSTSLLVNFPRPRFAVLPISLGLTLERFSGTLTIELPLPAPASPTTSQLDPMPAPTPTVHLSLHPDFALDLAITSLIGSRAKLQDVPKVEQLIGARVRGFIQDRVVWPGRVQVALPSVGGHHHHHHHHRHHRPSDAAGTGRPRRRSSSGHLDEQVIVDEDEEWEWRSSAGDSPVIANSASSAAPKGPGPTRMGGAKPVTNGNLAVVTPSTPSGLSSASTPSIDLHAAQGPSVILHPKLRSAASATEPISSPGEVSATTPSSALPSPSESIPGYFARPSHGTKGGRAYVNGSGPPPPPPLSRGGGRGRWVPRGTPTTGVSAGEHVNKLAAAATAVGNGGTAPILTHGNGASSVMTGQNGNGDANGDRAAGLRYRSGGLGTGVGIVGVGINGVGGPSRTGSSSGASWR